MINHLFLNSLLPIIENNILNGLNIHSFIESAKPNKANIAMNIFSM